MNDPLRILLFICFLPFAATSQNDSWMLPKKTRENRVMTCSVSLTTIYPGRDTVREKLCELVYNTKGQLGSLKAFRDDSVLDYEEIVTYDSAGRKTEFIQKNYPDLTFYNPKAKDNMAKQMTQEILFHNRNQKKSYRYNEQGLLAEKKYYDGTFELKEFTDNDICLKEYFTYNKQGQLLLEQDLGRSDPKSEFSPSDKILYTYDKANRLVKKISWQEHEKNTRVYKYNSEGKVAEVLNPRSKYKENYEYDLHGNKTRFTKTDSKGIIFADYSYRYKDTLLIEETFHNDKGDYNNKDTYVYDNLNRLIQEKNWSLDGSGYYCDPGDPYKIKLRRFDKDSNIIEEKRYYKKQTADDYAGRVEYTYNEKRQVIKERKINDDDTLYEIDLYEYNNKGQREKVIMLNRDSTLRNTEINFYNSLGVRYARELYTPENTLQLYQTYEYNKKGQEVGGIFFHGGPKEVTKEFEYKKNALLNRIRLTEKDKVLIYDYVYTYYY